MVYTSVIRKYLTKEDCSKIEELRKEGLDWNTISERYGMSKWGVWNGWRNWKKKRKEKEV